MDTITIAQDRGLNADYLITVRQFIDKNYVEKIARGECRVYLFHVDPPTADSSLANKEAYERLKQNGGLFTEVVSFESDHDGYVVLITPSGLGHIGTGDAAQLLVITHERWVIVK